MTGKQEFSSALVICLQDNVPQQENGVDCGVYCCAFAECISDGRPLTSRISARDVARLRQKMVRNPASPPRVLESASVFFYVLLLQCVCRLRLQIVQLARGVVE